MVGDIGIPEEFVTKRPSGLRELLFGAKLPHVVIALDGREWGVLDGQRVALRSLPAGAQTQALGVALDWLMKTARMAREDIYGSEGGDGALEVITRAVILTRALLDPQTLKPLCDGIEDVVGRLSDDDEDDARPGFTASQIAFLFNEWDRFQQSRSPFASLSEKGVEEHVAALGKGLTPPTSLTRFDRITLERIATSLAEILSKQTTPSSSGTSSQISSGDGSKPR